MKIVTIKMDLVIDDDITDIDSICKYLNDKLYGDPEFFGDFDRENIYEIREEDGTDVYSYEHGYFK